MEKKTHLVVYMLACMQALQDLTLTAKTWSVVGGVTWHAILVFGACSTCAVLQLSEWWVVVCCCMQHCDAPSVPLCVTHVP